MDTHNSNSPLEQQISQWRHYLRRRQAIHNVDIAELEDHLREQVSVLLNVGLTADEAFLVAVKRIGNLDELSREFAREHSDRLWKQLVLSSGSGPSRARTDTIVAFCLAVATALAIKAPALFGLQLREHGNVYARNLALFVLPLLTAYFVWKRRLATGAVFRLAIPFAAALVFANVYPFPKQASTEGLTALHLPIALWIVTGAAYAATRWRQVDGRMDFIRFSGELFIYYVLIALGGGVFMGFTAAIFRAIGVNVEPILESWIVPCGAAGAVIVASWLVEAKQSVIENMAPVLTRLFTPLFTVLLLMFLGTIVYTGRGVDIARNVLIAFDLLLVVVLGLLLYSISARDPEAPPNIFDGLQVVLVISALLADAVALSAIAARISEFGFTPNRVAALGENVILLVNLAWSAVLYIRFLRKRLAFTALERWQTSYLPVYAVWAAIVVIVFPPLFSYQ
ncbi:MAG: hypothetical protein IT168_11060 [Bryobacterales bacterium]|nr:hypothetical protein [Bryobacterales bacterium]